MCTYSRVLYGLYSMCLQIHKPVSGHDRHRAVRPNAGSLALRNIPARKHGSQRRATDQWSRLKCPLTHSPHAPDTATESLLLDPLQSFPRQYTSTNTVPGELSPSSTHRPPFPTTHTPPLQAVMAPGRAPDPETTKIDVRPRLDNSASSGGDGGVSTLSALAQATVPAWVHTAVMVSLIFGGCCSNVSPGHWPCVRGGARRWWGRGIRRKMQMQVQM